VLAYTARTALLDLLEVTPTTIAEVVAIMTRIDDVLPDDDGLKWFNRLYRMVTEEIDEDCHRQQWQSPDWLVHLDIEFAKLYFDAIHALTGWLPRFGSAEHGDYLRINKILDEVEVRAMQAMATGMIRWVSHAIQPLDRLAAMAAIGRARDLAWLSAIVTSSAARLIVDDR
jgi:hypothetical protein